MEQCRSALCTDQNTTGVYTWYSADTLYTTTTPCLFAPPYGWWSATADPDSSCSLLSDTLLICPEMMLEQNGNLLTASDLPGTYSCIFDGDTIPNAGQASLAVGASGIYTVTLVMPVGCTITTSILGLGPNSIEEIQGGHGLSIIPNPNSGSFQLLSGALQGKACMLQIMDLTGRIVHAERIAQCSSAQPIQVLHLNQGTYFVEVVAGTERYIGKLVLEQ